MRRKLLYVVPLAFQIYVLYRQMKKKLNQVINYIIIVPSIIYNI